MTDQLYTVTGDAKLDLLLGQQTLAVSGVQQLIAGKGNDTIVVAGHLDTISGGAGDDTILLKDGSSSHLLDGGEGANLLQNDRTQGKTNWHVLTRSGSLSGVDQFANIGATVDNSVGALYLLAGSMDTLVFSNGPSVLIRAAGGHTGSVDMGNFANRLIDAETGAGSGNQARTSSRSAVADLGSASQDTVAAAQVGSTLLTTSDTGALLSVGAETSRSDLRTYSGQALRPYAEASEPLTHAGQAVLTATGSVERIPDPVNTGSASNAGSTVKLKLKKRLDEEQSQPVKHQQAAPQAPAQQAPEKQTPEKQATPQQEKQPEGKPASGKGSAAASAPNSPNTKGSQSHSK